MIGILVTGHGSYPEGITESLKMIYGDISGYEWLNFDEGIDLVIYQEKLAKLISSLKEDNEEIVIITDLFGGTPFNQSMILSQEDASIDVITTLSLPVLLEAMMNRNKLLDKNEFISLLEKTHNRSFINGKKFLKNI